MTFVWIQLYLGTEKSDEAFKVRPIPNDVDDFKQEVKKEAAPDLNHYSTGNLIVYPAGTSVPVREGTVGLDPGDSVPTKTSSKKPLIVVAPVQAPPRGQQHDYGLTSLDGFRVPFLPRQESLEINNFPKIAPKELDNKPEVEEFMTVTHTRASNADSLLDVDRREIAAHGRQTFSPEFLAELAVHMIVGQFYLPLPRSSSADAMIRISERVMLNWQFKNNGSSISRKEMKEEAEKCSIGGWKVYLVVFCTGGHDLEGGNDVSFTHGGVTVVVLSRDSAEGFLGARLFAELESVGLAEDQARRLGTCCAPLRRKFMGN